MTWFSTTWRSFALVIATGLLTGGYPLLGITSPISIGNRVSLDRALIDGRESLEVMLAIEESKYEHIVAYVAALGGRVRVSERAIGYLRVELPTKDFAKLVSADGIDAYQIASAASSAWFHNSQPATNSTMLRRARVSDWSVGGDRSEGANGLPLLTPQDASATRYTGETGIGLEDFKVRHPTYDGRGVTIGLVEAGRVIWDHPAFSSATALDGSKIQKIAGLISSVAESDGDSTRVKMEKLSLSDRIAVRHENHSYTFPSPGQYRLGVYEVRLSQSTVQQFAVLLDESGSRVWVDTNSNGSFLDEQAFGDVNKRFDVRYLHVKQPNAPPVPFVATVAADRSAVNLYMPGAHNAMTASVAAGTPHHSTWVSGFAPGARLLLVNHVTDTGALSAYIEAMLAAAKHPEVDVVSDSFVIMHPDAHTHDAFIWLILGRMSKVYQKLILHASANAGAPLGSSSGAGSALSIGGFVSPETYHALIGVQAPGPTLAGKSPYGPSADGGMAPHLLVPTYRLAPYKRQTRDQVIPAYRPRFVLPDGHFMSCCTSSASPIAVGLVARLISGAKQRGIAYSPERLAAALLSTARQIQDAPVYAQGAGVIDIDRAWQALERQSEVPTIRFRAPLKHALTKYAPHPGVGVGLLELEGWQTGQSEERWITVRRESGPETLVAYTVGWTGNDGTFSSASRVELPLGKDVYFPIRIDVKTSGAHSSRLEIADEKTGVVSAQTLVTIVAPEALAANHYRRAFKNQVSPMQSREHFVSVSVGTALLRLEFTLESGVAQLDFVPPSRMPFYKYPHLLPWGGELSPGKYVLHIPNPEAGLWSFSVQNDPFAYAAELSDKPPEMARYQLTLSTASVAIETSTRSAGRIQLRLGNRGIPLPAAVLHSAPATIASRDATYLPSGLPQSFELNVAPGTSILRVTTRASAGASPLDMHLYNCTTGQCFSHEFALLARQEQSITVRNPAVGRWLALVSPGPKLVGSGHFEFEDVMVHGVPEASDASRGPRVLEEKWSAQLPQPHPVVEVEGRQPAIYVELRDDQFDREEHLFGVVPSDRIDKLTNRPVSLAALVYPLGEAGDLK